MNETDSYKATAKQNITIVISVVTTTVTLIILCVICLCCYASCVSSLNEDCDVEGPSWSTEVRNPNRKIRKRRSDRRPMGSQVKKSRARRQSTFIMV